MSIFLGARLDWSKNGGPETTSLEPSPSPTAAA
jgi:hypothetical protein